MHKPRLACLVKHRGADVPAAASIDREPIRRSLLPAPWQQRAVCRWLATAKGRTMPTELSRRGAVVLSAVCLACLMFGLEISSIPAILPTLERVLHADFKELQWIMNAYTIAVTTVLMATGTVADRYGRKFVFLVSIAAFGLTS